MTDKPELDPRLNAYRPDLADIALGHLVKADTYVEPKLYQCTFGRAPILATPDQNAVRVSEVRYGEFLDVFEERPDGYAWVQCRNDRAVGYMQGKDAFRQTIAAMVNRVCVHRTYVYKASNRDSAVLDHLTLGSFVSLDGEDGDYYALAGGGFVYKKHIVPADEVLTSDYVFTAGTMIGTPYLTGGRTPLGIDPTGLIQLALDLAGLEAPRFFSQQLEAYGHPLPCHWRDVLWTRGDLVFFENPEHVGVMAGPDHIIHASPYTMQVTAEPLEALMAEHRPRIIAAGRP